MVIGETYGRLLVIRDLGMTSPKYHSVECWCTCGGQKELNLYNIRSGQIQSCGCLAREYQKGTGKATKYKHIIGELYSGMKILAESRRECAGKQERRVKVRCHCGNIFDTRFHAIIQGITKSCGCLQRKSAAEMAKKTNRTHGLTKHPLYPVWQKMRRRCTDDKHDSWPYYGGKGVSVCEEWQEFLPFYTWSMEHGYKKGLEIDRIDNDGNYCPENCRWISHIDNIRNSSFTKLTVEKVKEIREKHKNGATKRGLAREYSVSPTTIWSIIYRRTWKNI